MASWAGDIVEVKRQRHTHSQNGDCWCNYGLPGFKVTDRIYKQAELTAITSG